MKLSHTDSITTGLIIAAILFSLYLGDVFLSVVFTGALVLFLIHRARNHINDHAIVLHFSRHKKGMLDAAMKDCDTEDQVLFMNAAVTFFIAAIEAKKKGRAVAWVNRETNQYKEVKMPLLDNVKSEALENSNEKKYE